MSGFKDRPDDRKRDDCRYDFTRNDPFDRTSPIRMVVDRLVGSRDYMKAIRDHVVAEDAIAIWYFGQNGFVLKGSGGTLFGIDLYLSNSCATTFADRPFRLDRQLPVFVEPEDLDVDYFITTHSHDDHADPETIRRLDRSRIKAFVGPWDSLRIFAECGVDETQCMLVHPGQRLDLPDGTTLTATFALPTDDTDLNHTGTLIEFPNGLRFFNTGDTAFADRLGALLPRDLDICAICINGGFHNLTATDAARIIKELRPRVAVPCHYDMMVNNVGDPDMFRLALSLVDAPSAFRQLRYYEPWVYRRQDYP